MYLEILQFLLQAEYLVEVDFKTQEEISLFIDGMSYTYNILYKNLCVLVGKKPIRRSKC